MGQRYTGAGQRFQFSILVIDKAGGITLGTKALLDLSCLTIWIKAQGEAAAVTSG
ncbi:hypothetical protein [Proteiniclasticum sp. QWL-01]|uniref:hypothetical protein n=1 Tax=Proteiniclasticum sp. QWL-01 TaxID=3036945 RepID=UPI0024103600|nr:hypothetical protein [Proteiniclasticum sp. QWL-01]WFF72351.1 hypothetical protein P6M73_13830 [Proteiniclasticum sp. QWL-01]